MKKLINLKVVLMIGLICFGCSGMSAEQRKDGTYDLRSGVGDKPFVGGYSDEAHDLAWFQAHGRQSAVANNEFYVIEVWLAYVGGKFRSLDPQAPRIVSASDDALIREQARELGAIVFFRKPIDDQVLLDAIRWANSGITV